MSKIVLRNLKPVDLILLFSGFLFALLLLAALVVPIIDVSFSSLGDFITQPLGGVAFLLLGIFVIRNLKQPQRNFGFFLIAASAFAFIVSAVMLVKSVI